MSFATGLSKGIPVGIQLGRATVEGFQGRGIREANEVLAEMEGMVPGQATAIPDGQGGTQTGYDGNEWDAAKQRYVKALRRVSDAETLERMMGNLADLEQGKVMEYGRMALASLRNGDYDQAQKYIAGVSYFTDPGVTPQFQVTQDGNVLVGGDGQKPMALTADNLEDFLHQFVDFKDYRKLAFDKEKHGDMMDYRERVFADEAAARAARLALEEKNVNSQIADRETRTGILQDELALKESETASKLAKDEAEIDYKTALTEAAENSERRAVEKWNIDKSASEKKAFTTGVEEAQTAFDEMVKDVGQQKGTVPSKTSDAETVAGFGGRAAIPTDEPVPYNQEEQEIIDESRRSTGVNDAVSGAITAELRLKQAAIEQQLLAGNGRGLELVNLTAEALQASDPNMSPGRKAAIMMRVLMSNSATGTDAYIASAGDQGPQLVIQNPDGGVDRFRIDPAFAPDLAGLIGTQPIEETPDPGPKTNQPR